MARAQLITAPAVEERLEAAVATGRITREQADEQLASAGFARLPLEETLEDEADSRPDGAG